MNRDEQPRTRIQELGWLSIGLGSFGAVHGWGYVVVELWVLERFDSLLFLVPASTILTGLAAIGIGQVGQRRWARRWAIGWAAAALAALAALEVAGILHLRAIRKPGPLVAVWQIEITAILLLLAVYPILTLWLMSTSRAKTEMTR